MQYSNSLNKFTSLKKMKLKIMKKIEKNKQIKGKLRQPIQVESGWCTNLCNLLLDISVGIESIFREIGEIDETVKKNDKTLIKELNQCYKKLPELVAAMLMEDVAIELMGAMDYRVHRVGSRGNESFRKMLQRHLKHEQTLKIVCFRYSAYW